jgi:hypothetical protein
MNYLRSIHPLIVGVCAGAATSLATRLDPTDWLWWIPFLGVGVVYAYITNRKDFDDGNSSKDSDS